MLGWILKRNPPKDPRKMCKVPRVFEVPGGLTSIILECLANIEANINPRWNRLRMWRLIEERCPDTKDGSTWVIKQEGCHLYVVEEVEP